MSTKVRRRLLLVEFGSHLLGMRELARMLQDDWRMSFAIRHRNRVGSWRDEFIDFSRYSGSLMIHVELPRIVFSITRSRWLARLVGDSLFYGRALLLTLRSQRVLITTGPEHRGHIETFFLWLIVFVGRSRVILNVRDGRWYLEALRNGTRDTQRDLVASSIRRVRRFAFETEGVRKNFLGLLPSESVSAVIPWIMSDMIHDRSTTRNPKPEKLGLPIVIGVLGTFDSSRRDYGTLVEALRNLSREERRSLRLVFLAGSLARGSESEIQRHISKLVDADFPDELGYLESYHMRGSACDILLAPLKQGVGYGETKGSGAFGDVLAMRKRLIAPVASDPLREFATFTNYYRDPSDLSNVLRQTISNPHAMLSVNQTEYEQWSAPLVYQRAIAIFS